MSASVKLFDNSVLFASATNSQRGDAPSYRYDGILDSTLTFDDLDNEYTTWFAVAVRQGSATLTISYTTAGTETILVEPGLPVLIQTLDNDTLSGDPTLAPGGTQDDVELFVYTSNNPLNPSAGAFLILDAALGVTTDNFDATLVDSWKDVRGLSLAPLDFDWVNGTMTRPSYNVSDPDFNLKPSISWESLEFNAGNYFLYSGADSVFNFMESSGDFTMITVLKLPDNAVDEDDEQGLWNCANATAKIGWRALVEGGMRHKVGRGATGSTLIGEEEIDTKATIMIHHYNSSDGVLNIYWQGRWHSSQSHPSATGDQTRLGVGASPMESDVMRMFRGKFAKLMLWNRALTAGEISIQLSALVTTYGIDDTETQGFPWITDCVNMHRANRGISFADPEQTLWNTWVDTRDDMTADAQTFAGGADKPTYDPNDGVFSRPGLVFDGTNDTLINNFSNTSGDHLGGSGMTITIVMYRDGDADTEGLFTMSSYGAGLANPSGSTLDGTSLFFGNDDNHITYTIDNGSDDDVVYDDTGPDLVSLTPYAIVFRSDGDYYRINEMNLTTGEEVNTKYATLSATESTAVSASVYLFAFTDSSGYLKGGLAEVTTTDSSRTNDEVAEFFTYARNRYGS